jgi:hypothetical protein
MKSHIIIHGSQIHEIAFRLDLLQYARRNRFQLFEAFNDPDENEEQVVVYVEGDEKKINDLIAKIQIIKPESAIVHGITMEPFDGEILSLSFSMFDIYAEQIIKGLQEISDM